MFTEEEARVFFGFFFDRLVYYVLKGALGLLLRAGRGGDGDPGFQKRFCGVPRGT